MKKKTVLEKLAARVNRTNAAFKKMTSTQKKVQIAKDVLAQMAAKRIRPIHGLYIDVSEKTAKAVYEDKSVDVKEAMTKMPTCNACAIGSVFVATVERLDKLKLDNMHYIGDDDVMRKYLRSMLIFTQRESQLLETVFECEGPYKYDKATPRMKAIMNAIIENKGKISKATFKHLEAPRD